MPECPFETNQIICASCGDNLYNVDGQEIRTSDPLDLKSFGLLGKAIQLVFGGRCDICGGPIGYVPQKNRGFDGKIGQ